MELRFLKFIEPPAIDNWRDKAGSLLRTHANQRQTSPGAKKILVIIAVLAGSEAASAQDVVMTSTPDKWQFSVLAYGWVPTIKGSVSFPIANTGGSITADPNNIFNNLNLAFMGSFGVMYNRWGFFTDALYMNLGHTKTGYKDFTLPNQEPGNLNAFINLTVKTWIVTSAFQYKVVELPTSP